MSPRSANFHRRPCFVSHSGRWGWSTDNATSAADQRGLSRIRRKKSVPIRVDPRQISPRSASFHRRPCFVSHSGRRGWPTDNTTSAADHRGSSRIRRKKSVPIRVDPRQISPRSASFHRRPCFVSHSGRRGWPTDNTTSAVADLISARISSSRIRRKKSVPICVNPRQNSTRSASCHRCPCFVNHSGRRGWPTDNTTSAADHRGSSRIRRKNPCRSASIRGRFRPGALVFTGARVLSVIQGAGG